MAQGKVIVKILNQGQGAIAGVEKLILFVGLGLLNHGNVLALNSQSDLDELLGKGDSSIKTQVRAAQLNGGENWNAYALPLTDNKIPLVDWVDAAMEVVSPEMIALCDTSTSTATSKANVAKLSTISAHVLNTYSRRVILLAATAGITAEQTWEQYQAQQIALQKDVADKRLCLVPLLHGNDLGCLAGRLCSDNVSIADSPMRVNTGSVIGLGDAPMDKNKTTLTDAVLSNLDRNRLTVIQRYVDYPGIYFGDANLLDAPGGDFQVIEHLRIADKAARAIRFLSIGLIADRKINNSPVSESFTKNHLSRPLREMSRSTTVGGVTYPGEIKPPKEGDVVLNWINKNTVHIYFKARPHESPKEIVDHIALDLSI